jgi:capsular polysaccharide biosynthesis protein
VADRRAVGIVLAGAAAGLALGVAVTLLTPEAYRATTVLRVSAAADPRLPASQQRHLPADVLAESYAALLREEAFLAGLAPRVAGGRLDAGELARRVDATHADGSALVEVTAEAGSREEAQAIATQVAGALLALVRQLARQAADQRRAELTRRLAQTPAGRAGAAQRRALAAELARTSSRRVEQAESVRVVAAAYAPADPVRPDPVQNLAGGLLLGLVAGLGTTLLRRPAPAGAAPRVALRGPPPESTVAGAAAFRIEAWAGESDVAAIELLVSDGAAAWRPVAHLEAAPAEVEWDTTSVADGAWWVTAVARDRNGRAAATRPLLLRVGNQQDAGLSSPA